jgi:hypothetical protein
MTLIRHYLGVSPFRCFEFVYVLTGLVVAQGNFARSPFILQ